MAINLETIQREIQALEDSKVTSHSACQKLAALYVVTDHLSKKRMAEGVTPDMQGSDFLRACSGVRHEALMRVLDDHMSALSVLHPDMYTSLLDKVRALR